MKPIHITIILCIVLSTSFFNQSVCAQTTLNQEATDTHNNIILLGKSTRERLQQEPFGVWFNANYTAYAVDTPIALQLKPLLKDKHFVIFMGTWCGDSRREVPRIYKLLDCCGVNPSQIELVNVNNSDSAYKQSPGHEEKGLNIHRVPDLLVYTGQKELGRIVETPVESWEKDLLSIVTGKPYVPNYKGATSLSKALFLQPGNEMAAKMLHQPGH